MCFSKKKNLASSGPNENMVKGLKTELSIRVQTINPKGDYKNLQERFQIAFSNDDEQFATNK